MRAVKALDSPDSSLFADAICFEISGTRPYELHSVYLVGKMYVYLLHMRSAKTQTYLHKFETSPELSLLAYQSTTMYVLRETHILYCFR